MSGLDKFFEKRAPPLHPKVGYWQSVLKQGRAAQLRITFVREKEGLVYGPAKLFVHFYDVVMEEVQSPDEVEWDERVNAELVKLGAAALSTANEMERFGMVFNDRFRVAENRFGDTFYNATLVTYLQHSAFARLPPTNDVLSRLRDYVPSLGKQREECEELIEDVIGYCIEALHDLLRYSRPETTEIVAGSLAYYLDERFSISDRKLLGW